MTGTLPSGRERVTREVLTNEKYVIIMFQENVIIVSEDE